MIEFYGISDVGCVRQENQDRIVLEDSLGMFGVADGMGGHRNGSIAAELAISTLRYYVEASAGRCDVSWPFGYSLQLSLQANRLSTAIRLASRQVWRHADEGPQFAGMGTTIAAVLCNEETAVIGNVGDSRVYLFREGQLTQLTHDDTWLNALSQCATKIAKQGLQNVLTQAIGSQETVDVHISEQPLNSNDQFLLTSDGLHGVIPDETIRSILQDGGNLQETVEQLLALALEKRAPDNVSIVLLKCVR